MNAAKLYLEYCEMELQYSFNKSFVKSIRQMKTKKRKRKVYALLGFLEKIKIIVYRGFPQKRPETDSFSSVFFYK